MWFTVWSILQLIYRVIYHVFLLCPGLDLKLVFGSSSHLTTFCVEQVGQGREQSWLASPSVASWGWDFQGKLYKKMDFIHKILPKLIRLNNFYNFDGPSSSTQQLLILVLSLVPFFRVLKILKEFVWHSTNPCTKIIFKQKHTWPCLIPFTQAPQQKIQAHDGG